MAYDNMRIGTMGYVDEEAERRRKAREALTQAGPTRYNLGVTAGQTLLRPGGYEGQAGGPPMAPIGNPVRGPGTTGYPSIMDDATRRQEVQDMLSRRPNPYTAGVMAGSGQNPFSAPTVRPPTPAILQQPAAAAASPAWNFAAATNAAAEAKGIKQYGPGTLRGTIASAGFTPESQTLAQAAQARLTPLQDEALLNTATNRMNSVSDRRAAQMTIQQNAQMRNQAAATASNLEFARIKEGGDIAKAMAMGQVATIGAESREKVAGTNAGAKKYGVDVGAGTAQDKIDAEMQRHQATIDAERENTILKLGGAEGIAKMKAENDRIIAAGHDLAGIEKAKQENVRLVELLKHISDKNKTGAEPAPAPVTTAPAATTQAAGTYYSPTAKKSYKRNPDGSITWI